jgi:hydroxypyruvate isomerase
VTIRLAPNLSLLWTDVPLEERFERAADAGFSAVELWWPGDELAQRLPDLTSSAGVELALLNFDAGDMPTGDRGLASDPDRFDQLRANVPLALSIANEAGCQRLNLLVGLALDMYEPAEQLGWARANAAWAADQAAAQGATVMVEAVNTLENGPYLLSTTAAAAAFVESVDRPNVRIQYDAYHMQRMEGNLTATLERYWDMVGHIQIADAPGRNQPGTGEINFAHIWSVLERLAYDGFVGLEYKPLGQTDGSFGWIEELGITRGAS